MKYVKESLDPEEYDEFDRDDFPEEENEEDIVPEEEDEENEDEEDEEDEEDDWYDEDEEEEDEEEKEPIIVNDDNIIDDEEEYDQLTDDLKTILDNELNAPEFNREMLRFKNRSTLDIFSGVPMAKINNDTYVFKLANGKMKKEKIHMIDLIDNEDVENESVVVNMRARSVNEGF
jgi:hypothetical protein